MRSLTSPSPQRATALDIREERFAAVLGFGRGRPYIPVTQPVLDVSSHEPLPTQWLQCAAYVLKRHDPLPYTFKQARVRLLHQEERFADGRSIEVFLNVAQRPAGGTGRHGIVFESVGRLYSAAGEPDRCLERCFDSTVITLDEAAERNWDLLNPHSADREDGIERLRDNAVLALAALLGDEWAYLSPKAKNTFLPD